jgi:tetraacyldisaccharide 4'-kinase
VSASAERLLQRVWYDREARWLSLVLLPLSWLFGLIVACRRGAYRAGLFRRVRLARPVVVIGNITVGGTGKTPFTIWLAERLQARGVSVGIVLRGYGGTAVDWPRDVSSDAAPEEVGDEAVLLARRTGAIVVAGPDRVAAARRAIERGAQIVLSDDGLQHYRLARDREIVVVDGRRGVGNRRLLPAGPLREPVSRLGQADLRVISWRDGSARPLSPVSATIQACAQLESATALVDGETRPLASFTGSRVHAVAAIGHPQQFFAALQQLGIEVAPHALPDHARLTAQDIRFPDDLPVLMTEKDAVKCVRFADRRHWAVRMDVVVNAQDAAAVDAMLDRLVSGESATIGA